MRNGLATFAVFGVTALVGLGAVTMEKRLVSLQTHRGVILSETYEKNLESYVLRVAYENTTNDFIVIEHPVYQQKHKNLADVLEKGDVILFRYIRLDSEKKLAMGTHTKLKKLQTKKLLRSTNFLKQECPMPISEWAATPLVV